MLKTTERTRGEAYGLSVPSLSMLLAVARRGVAVGVGYCAAVSAATAVTVAHLLLPTVLPDDGAMGSLASAMRELPGMLVGGLAITAYAAWPGFLLVVLAAARCRWRGMPFFMAAGAFNVWPSLWMAGPPGPMMGEGFYFLFCCVGGGLAGGFAYWFVAEYPRQPVTPASSAPGPSGS